MTSPAKRPGGNGIAAIGMSLDDAETAFDVAACELNIAVAVALKVASPGLDDKV
jgi:hypothetical protein